MFGVFCLTEPDHGSDIARGLSTTASRDGDTWTINGAKRWIGGAGSATTLAVFARDTADGEVKVFLVPREAAGVTLTKMEGKIALRIMQNYDIVLNDVTVSDDTRLANVNSFADVARLLGNTRSIVAWIACGAMAGAYAPAYAMTVGEAKVLSYTDQPLRVLIQLKAQGWEWKALFASVQTYPGLYQVA
jgi:glutaryl-CoA dehydrogenase